MKRKWEIIAGSIGGVVSLIFFGGVSVTMKQMSQNEFIEMYRDFAKDGNVSATEAYHSLTNITNYFSIALFLSIIFLIVAICFSIKDKYLIVAVLLYAIAGIVLLLGTQMIAYPFSFFYFVACGLATYRLIKRREIIHV
ncbi:hypothetical protein BAU15_00550 [Enterococcus sp. JM4C]|uniref:DUF4064 domain-containing protein n=1 Tax=Candidatus Enterococcus huntleyi TaxID=1857217 RepID=UPI00137B134D|nr:DUF4064 domain-containing protein [Enterococcus sp. JM4C]KAF1299169.1 hypothetical protein BAU15_00550 [Enterococcus sp. JM4C]